MSTAPKTVWIINQYASSPSTGFAGRHYYLARELAVQGHHVYLVAASFTHLLRHPPEVKNDITLERVEGFHIVWVRVPIYHHAHSKKRVLNWFRFSKLLRKLPDIIPDRPDAILYSSPSLVGYLGAQRLARQFDVPIIFEVRDIWPLTMIQVGGYSRRHLFMRFLQWVEDRAYQISDSVISNLPNAVDHMQARGMDPAKFSLVPNGISVAEVSNPEPLDPDTRSQLPQEKFVIGYTGTLGVANAMYVLLEAAEILKPNDDIAFVLVGGGKEKAALQAQAEKLGLDNVVFINPIPKEQVQSILAYFDVCFIGWQNDPLYRFGIGANKLPEYLYSATPILHSFSGNGDPVAEAGAGITVPAEDPEAVARGVLELKAMPKSARSEMGRMGRAYALKNHDYIALAYKLDQVIQEAHDG